MYAELELLGVGIAMLADRWLRRPTKFHAPLLGALVLVGLYTHVSMFLLAVGLLTLAGVRRDREAWRWRAAIAAAVGIWAVTWGPHFLVQARGGHSSWIPPTTFGTLTTAIARSVTFGPAITLAVVAAVVAGAVIVFFGDRPLWRVWAAASPFPSRSPPGGARRTGGAGPYLHPHGLGTRRRDRVPLRRGAPTAAISSAWRHRAAAFVIVPSADWAIESHPGPTEPLTALDRRIRPGDIVAVRPTSKAVELEWSLAVRNGLAARSVTLPALPETYALRLGTGPATGRGPVPELAGEPFAHGLHSGRDRLRRAMELGQRRDQLSRRPAHHRMSRAPNER